MGNFNSCVSSASGGRSGAAARVIFPGGEVRSLAGPTKAAELMLETPSHFLVNARSVQPGRRFAALSADHDLEASQVYVMFPMKRVNAVVNAGDMGFTAAKKRGSGGRSRILPECFDGCADDHDVAEVVEPTNIVDGAGEGESLNKLNLDDIDDVETKEFMNRLSMSRSKKPLLQTIAEEPSKRECPTGQTLESASLSFKSGRQYVSTYVRSGDKNVHWFV